MPTKLTSAKETRDPKGVKTAQAAKIDASLSEEESLYEPRTKTSSEFAFGVKLFVIAGLIILLFWFLNRSV